MSGRVRETSLLLTAMQRYARDGNTLDKGASGSALFTNVR